MSFDQKVGLAAAVLVSFILGTFVGSEVRENILNDYWQQKVAATSCAQFNAKTGEFEINE